MLARYKIPRGPDEKKRYPLPRGIRKDTRRHIPHCLAPKREMVDEYLDNPNDKAWDIFERKYLALLHQRFATNPEPFEMLCQIATEKDVFLGCSCPTKKNPDVYHCHTVLALKFMQERFVRLDVVFP